MTECPHASPADHRRFRVCTLGLYNGRPHVKVCRHLCSKNPHHEPHPRLHAAAAPVAITIRGNPAPAVDVAIAEPRAVICESCEHAQRVSRVVGKFAVYVVKCRRCGCGGLSLTEGACPLGKWP